MARKIISTTIILVIITIGLFFIYQYTNADGWLSALITFGTISYHFVMRLFVGVAVDGIMHNHADYEKKWFRIHSFEESLYKKLQVKNWKNKLPTYKKDSFSLQKLTFDEIAQATCQAEITHEVISVLSFVPLLASLKFDSFLVFFTTSLLAACFDMIFVIIQRFNRPRLVKLAKRAK